MNTVWSAFAALAAFSMMLISAGVWGIFADNAITMESHPMIAIAGVAIVVFMFLAGIIMLWREALDIYTWLAIKRLDRRAATPPKATALQPKPKRHEVN